MILKIWQGLLALITSLAIVASLEAVAAADVGDEVLQGGAWHFKSVACTDTTVLEVAPRLTTEGQKVFTAQDFQQSGVYVEFKTGLGISTVFPGAHASVTHYQGIAQNNVMMAERKGDRVQVCFLEAPYPYYGKDGKLLCNPDVDSRGRTYRVYDYRLGAAYYGWNSQHGCGGA